MRGIYVKDPASVVIIKSTTNAQIMIPCKDSDDILLRTRGEKGRISWADYVSAKTRPGFGQMIELDDSVTITNDGYIAIAATSNSLNENSMSELLVLGVERIKETILSMNAGEKLVFLSFLDTRIEFDIEIEKCSELKLYVSKILNLDKETVTEEVVAEVPKPPTKPKGRGKARKNEVVLKDNEDNLAIKAIRKNGDS